MSPYKHKVERKEDFFAWHVEYFCEFLGHSIAKIVEQARFCSSIGEYRIFEPQWPPLEKL